MSKKTVIIASDHAGYELKESLKVYLEGKGYSVKDEGTYSAERTDYPDYAHALAVAVEEDKKAIGLLMCGSANGVNMTANKHNGIRAAIAWNPEIASLARAHNDANVLSLPARYITDSEAKAIVDAFLSAEFEGGRHENRVNKIDIAI